MRKGRVKEGMKRRESGRGEKRGERGVKRVSE